MIVFTVAQQRFALPLRTVIRVVRAVEVTPLSGAPSPTLGVIDLSGQLVPVLSVRQRLGLADAEEIRISDHFIISRTSHRTLALVVDEVECMTTCAESKLAELERVAPELDRLAGVLHLPDGLVVVLNLERFLTSSEEASLNMAVTALSESASAPI